MSDEQELLATLQAFREANPEYTEAEIQAFWERLVEGQKEHGIGEDDGVYQDA